MRDVGAIAVGQIAGVGFGVATVVLVSRLLGPARYGSLAVALALAQLVFVLCFNWLMTAGVRFVAAARAAGRNPGRIVGSWLALLGLGLLPASLAVRLWVHDVRDTNTGLEGTIFAFVCAVVGARAVEQLLQATEQAEVLATGRALAKLLLCGCLAALTLLDARLGVRGVLVVMASAFAFQAIFGAWFVRPTAFASLSIDLRMSREIVVYSAPLFLRSALHYGLDWVDIFVLRAYGTASEVGVYHVAYQWMIAATEFLGGAMILVLPRLAADHALGLREVAESYVTNWLPRASTAWCGLRALGGLGAVTFVPAILGVGFEWTGRLLCVLLVGALFQSLIYASRRRAGAGRREGSGRIGRTAPPRIGA